VEIPEKEAFPLPWKSVPPVAFRTSSTEKVIFPPGPF
jgi:hypothetical protein